MWNAKLNKVRNNSLPFIGPERTTNNNVHFKIEQKRCNNNQQFFNRRKLDRLTIRAKFELLLFVFSRSAEQYRNKINWRFSFSPSLSLPLFIFLFHMVSFHFMSFELNINSKYFSASIDLLMCHRSFVLFIICVLFISNLGCSIE